MSFIKYILENMSYELKKKYEFEKECLLVLGRRNNRSKCVVIVGLRNVDGCVKILSLLKCGCGVWLER